jgi:hypothetical protein
MGAWNHAGMSSVVDGVYWKLESAIRGSGYFIFNKTKIVFHFVIYNKTKVCFHFINVAIRTRALDRTPQR